jgi:hypothetical protein
MVKIYVELIKKGKRTIDEVPVSIRGAVKAALEAEEAES